ncbi:MAG: hypothetical protein ACLUEA_06205 [Romboutsia timonensis]|mgnify:CR=1 FL=1
MINEHIEQLFIENLKINIGKNKPIAKDDIVRFAQEQGIKVGGKDSIASILERIDDNDLIDKLYNSFVEYIYIPSWKVAKYYGLESYQLEQLKQFNLIEADTKEGSFYSRESRCNISYDLYPFDMLFKYNSEQLKDLYNKTFNKPSYKLRLGTKNKEDVQIIINELEKVFKVGTYESYENRNKQGYYSYFDIELMNNNEQSTNTLQTKINELESQIQSLKLENSKLQNKIECSTIKNERGAGRKKKFTTDQVNDILKARNEGKSIRLLAKEFNCSIGLIHKLINEHNK